MMDRTSESASFFTKDRNFYKAFFSMLTIVALQNLIAYSVNMVDNIMLGNYSQLSLSGAATVNQVFFIVNQFAIAIGNCLVAISAQYYGKKEFGAIRTISGIALKLGLCISVVLTVVSLAMPRQLLQIFTSSDAIIDEGLKYFSIIVWTFIIYFISQILISALRAVRIVKISFFISLVSLIVNVGLNWILIFGHFGFPEMGIVGAAVGTLIGRIVELIIVVIYVAGEKTLKLFSTGFLRSNKLLRNDFLKLQMPMMASCILWGLSVPIQSAILGHLSDDAVAANSVATTFYTSLKVIVQAQASVSAVMIGNAIGRGDVSRVKSDARTLSLFDFIIGLLLGIAIAALKNPLLSMYNLNENTMMLTGHLILIMAFVMAGMSYQMPVGSGIIQGGGDAKYSLILNLISQWGIVMPLSFMAAFWWKLPVEWVVLILQSDQIFKCLPIWLHFRKYTWMRKLTRENIT